MFAAREIPPDPHVCSTAPLAGAASEARVAALTAEAARVAGTISALQADLVGLAEQLAAEAALDAPLWSWLAWQCGLTPAEARQISELVDRLSELPRCRERLASGELSLGTVLSLARRATPALEETILHSTRHATAGQLQALLRTWERQVAPADRPTHRDPADPDADPVPSRMRAGWRDGRYRGSFDLDTADGTLVAAALDAHRGRDQVSGEPDPGLAGVTGRERSLAEALVSLADTAADASAGPSGVAAERYRVNVEVLARELPEGDGLLVERAYVSGGPPIPRCLLPELLAQGSWTSMLVVDGIPLTTTTDTRFATPAQRRALLARDGHCQYPGCGATHTLVAHHIEPHANGGPTALANLVLVCRRHHRLVHRRRLTARRADGRWVFERPDGNRLTPTSKPPPPTLPRPPLVLRRRRTGTHDPLTHWARDVIVTQWLTHRAA